MYVRNLKRLNWVGIMYQSVSYNKYELPKIFIRNGRECFLIQLERN